MFKAPNERPAEPCGICQHPRPVLMRVIRSNLDNPVYYYECPVCEIKEGHVDTNEAAIKIWDEKMKVRAHTMLKFLGVGCVCDFPELEYVQNESSHRSIRDIYRVACHSCNVEGPLNNISCAIALQGWKEMIEMLINLEEDNG